MTPTSFTSKEQVQSGNYVLVFTKPNCGPCNMYKDEYRHASRKLEETTPLIEVDCSKHMEYAVDEIGISSAPTTVFMKDGVEIHRVSGVIPCNTVMELADEYLG